VLTSVDFEGEPQKEGGDEVDVKLVRAPEQAAADGGGGDAANGGVAAAAPGGGSGDGEGEGKDAGGSVGAAAGAIEGALPTEELEVPGDVVDDDNGSYRCSYTPATNDGAPRGWRLAVRVNGTHVAGSPFAPEVTSFSSRKYKGEHTGMWNNRLSAMSGKKWLNGTSCCGCSHPHGCGSWPVTWNVGSISRLFLPAQTVAGLCLCTGLERRAIPAFLAFRIADLEWYPRFYLVMMHVEQRMHLIVNAGAVDVCACMCMCVCVRACVCGMHARFFRPCTGQSCAGGR
jgi:hypothetical protein